MFKRTFMPGGTRAVVVSKIKKRRAAAPSSEN